MSNLTKAFVFNRIIERMGYNTYLEIGVDRPSSTFNHIDADRTGVDPYNDDTQCHAWNESNKIEMIKDINGKFYPFTSDEFFSVHNNSKYSLILIDGLHTEAQVDKDIRNSLSVLEPMGCLLIDDCCPNSWTEAQEEPNKGGAWRGTVYRSFWKLRTDPRYITGVIHEINVGFCMERPADRPAPRWGHPTAQWVMSNNNATTYDYYLENRSNLMNEVYADSFFKKYL